MQGKGEVVRLEGKNEKKVTQIVRDKLGVAEDNLHRANLQFGKMSESELSQKWGESGHSCRFILTEYEDEVNDLKECLAWLSNPTR